MSAGPLLRCAHPSRCWPAPIISWEIPWTIRAWSASLLGAIGLIVAVQKLTNVFRTHNHRSTAAALEQRFDDLGQSVRTSIELNQTDDASDRFSASLLTALGENVRERTDELRLREAVPTGSMQLAAGLLAVVLVIIASVCSSSWQWRTAAGRVLAAKIPYTAVSVEPGDMRVEQNESIRLITHITGRTNRETALLTREFDQANSEWKARPLTDSERLDQRDRELVFAVNLSNVAKPFEYRVVSGGYSSPIHTVDVQYPLTIASFETRVDAPAYTQRQPRLVTTGNFHAVEGSIARFKITLSKVPENAWLELRPLQKRLGEDAETETIPLSVSGRILSAELQLSRDVTYKVHATSADGLQLRRNRYRIRVHEDRPPRVTFQSLKPTARVHALSEIELRLNVADDYGLKRAGIVFQFNNEPELVLESVDFEDIVLPDGTLTPRTKETVRSMLELEYLEMTEKDSISYYGFAEDKRPGEPNINETELRFIDVLPFRRLFIQSTGNQRLRGGLGRRRNQNNAPQFPALSTLIGKERSVLNRSLQMERSDRRGQKIDVATLDSVVNSQNKNSEGTGRLGDRASDLEMQFGIPEEGRISDLLYQARDSMLLAADSLNSVDFDVATLQERDALGYLNEARSKLEAQLRGQRFARFRQAVAGAMGGRRNNRSQRRTQKRGQKAELNEIVKRLKDAAGRQQLIMEDYAKLVRDRRADDDDADHDLSGHTVTDEAQLTFVRGRIQKVQAGLLADLRDISEVAENLENLSEFSKQQALQAATTAEEVDDAVANGDWTAAMETAARAGPSYRLLAVHMDAVGADDVSRRIGTARDLGIQLAEGLRDQARRAIVTERSRDEGNPPLSNPQVSPLVQPMSQLAELNTEIGRTFDDIVKSVIDPELGIDDPEDVVVRRLQHLINENEFNETIERLPPILEMIDGRQWPDVALQTEDIAERLDIFTQRLDAMQREIMSPRIERLRQLANRAATARLELSQLATEDQIDRWILSVDGLLSDIEESGAALKQVEQLRNLDLRDAEAKDSAEVGDDNRKWPMNRSKTAFIPPAGYRDGLSDIISEIERHIQELLINDKPATFAGAVPPKYKRLVDLFHKSLADQSIQPQMMVPNE